MTWHKYLFTLGLYGIWRKRKTFVLTDRRVVVGQGVVLRTERSIPLDRVDDARYRRRGVSAYAEVVVGGRDGQRVERIGPMLPFTAKSFTQEVLART